MFFNIYCHQNISVGITEVFHIYCHQNNVVTKMIVPVFVYSQILIFSQDFLFKMMYPMGLVAQWITFLTTDQKIPGSNPGKLVWYIFLRPIYFLPNSSNRGFWNYFVFQYIYCHQNISVGITEVFHIYCHQNNVVTNMIVPVFVYSQILIFSQDFLFNMM